MKLIKNFIASALQTILCLGALLVPLLISQQSLAVQDAAAYTSAARYDLVGRVTGTIKPDPDGSGTLSYMATRSTYNSKGQLTLAESGELAQWQDETIKPKNWIGFTVLSKTAYTYDSIGRRVTDQKQDINSNTLKLTQYSYIEYDQVECKAVRMNPNLFNSLPASACSLGGQGTYGADRVTRYEYNTLEQVVKEYRAVGTSLEQLYRQNIYDTSFSGRLKGIKDAKGNYTELRYTGARLERRVYPSKTQPGSLNESDYNQYTYDLNGNVTVERKRNGVTITNTYDNLNRVTFRDRTGTVNDMDYTYDLRGLALTSKFRATGQGVTNIFDGFGDIKTSTNTMGGVTRTLSYLYDNNGNRTRVTHPDNVYFTYTFDGINRVNRVSESLTTTLLTVGYDRDGARKNIARTGGAVTNYDFDEIGRLTSFNQDVAGANTTNDLTNTFTYSPSNQIVKLDLSNDLYHYTGNTNVTGSYVSNGLNQYTSAGGLSLNYDANGNLTFDGLTTYNYDEENRLTSTSGGASSSFQYDPLGRLFSVILGGVTTQFLYDGDSLVAEYVNGTMTRRYVHGDRVDEPWVQYNGTTIGSASRRYLHADHQGSIIAHTNGSSSALNLLSYDAYGIPKSTNIVRFGYTGQLWMKEVGLFHYKARMYSPKLGRFLQTDPIFYEDQMNMYAYVGNDPVNKIDPTGMKDEPFDSEKHKQKRTHWNSETPMGGKKDPYNCHSAAWNDGKGDPTDKGNEGLPEKWDNSPTDDMAGAEPLSDSDPNVVGDVVVYGNDYNQNGVLEGAEGIDKGGEVTHSATVIEVDEKGNTTRVRSKEGQGPITEHHPRQALPLYGSTRNYFRKN